MSAMQRNDEKTHNPDMLLLDRMVILIALVVSGCGTRQPAPATEQATETPEPRPTITRAPISTASPPPPSPTPTLGIGSTQISLLDGMLLMYIPAGSFQMGSDSGESYEQPAHTVALDAFWIDQTEVTNAMYMRCVDSGYCTPPDSTGSETRTRYYDDSAYAGYPVVWVDWAMAATYCEWVGRRLPTEAEWEYAARGGLASAIYPWGDEWPVCTLGAQNGAQFWLCPPNDTLAVGSFAPNGYGLFDMAGNVWEWVADWYAPYSSDAVENPTGPTAGEDRVMRGSAAGYDGSSLRVSNRYWFDPDLAFRSLGFRCALSP